MPENYTWDQLLDDLSYFTDELRALKPLIKEVPVYENPGNELSIEELLYSIDEAQCSILNSESIPFNSIVERIKKSREARGEADIDKTLSNLLANRNSLIEKADSFTNALTRLSELIIFERKQLRIIAEHILTITSED
ncbi:MAG: hypothetical protein JJU41_01820 [Bacteroidetes bacterium]|nr:hypothetical protein [Bacteroidota bacterium]MCH8523631.1 hypothetical protein [Balneolales bacterium]